MNSSLMGLLSLPPSFLSLPPSLPRSRSRSRSRSLSLSLSHRPASRPSHLPKPQPPPAAGGVGFSNLSSSRCNWARTWCIFTHVVPYVAYIYAGFPIGALVNLVDSTFMMCQCIISYHFYL
jgi:hypothetical protein